MFMSSSTHPNMITTDPSMRRHDGQTAGGDERHARADRGGKARGASSLAGGLRLLEGGCDHDRPRAAREVAKGPDRSHGPGAFGTDHGGPGHLQSALGSWVCGARCRWFCLAAHVVHEV